MILLKHLWIHQGTAELEAMISYDHDEARSWVPGTWLQLISHNSPQHPSGPLVMADMAIENGHL